MAKARTPEPKRKGEPDRPTPESSEPIVSRAKAVPLVRDLRQALDDSGATWSINELLSDTDELPAYPLGGEPAGLIPASQAPPVDFEEISRIVPANPYLVAHRLQLDLVHPDVEELARAIVAQIPAKKAPRTSTRKTATSRSAAKKTDGRRRKR